MSGNVNATGGAGAAGIGSGEGVAIYNLLLYGGTINATGGTGAAGLGSGKNGSVDSVFSISGGTINATGGTGGAGIGSGQNGSLGYELSISGDEVITATGGAGAAGIGSGSGGSTQGISLFETTKIVAKGGSGAFGIGSGSNGGTVGDILIGKNSDIDETDITATTGRTDGKYAIGGYSDAAGTTAVTVTLTPTRASVKAGSGEGKDLILNAVNGAGETLYALSLSYLNDLLQDGDLTITANGADGSSISFPLDALSVTNSTGTLDWGYINDGIQHFSESDAYVWLTGEDVTLTFRDDDGTEGTVDLKFFADEELFRFDESDLPKDEPIVTPPSGGNGSVTPDVPQEPEELTRYSGIILQVGANSENTFEIPKFYLSRESLGLDALDISTQENAQDSIDLVGDMINRISEIRGTYGALQNGLEHTIDNLNVNVENLTAAESQIRDTDMAEEMMKYTKNNILIQSAQAMLAQANTVPQGVLQLLQ
ncbi:MAG: hypothetical protein IJF15_05210 [Oscillospiraceae bacterium]|nr:hypothetical protein [Oscillospiraceae bacterium]